MKEGCQRQSTPNKEMIFVRNTKRLQVIDLNFDRLTNYCSINHADDSKVPSITTLVFKRKRGTFSRVLDLFF